MKKYLHKKKIDIPIYVGKLEIVLTNQETKIYEGIVLYEAESGKAVMASDEDETFLLIVAFNIDKSFNNGIVSHECLHAVMYLFNHIKLQLSEDAKNGNEAYTYMLGWFVNQVYDFMKEKNIKIK